MNPVELCIDGSSPELSTPCPSGRLFAPPHSLPATGLEEFAWLIFLAVTLLAVGVGIWLLSKDAE